MEDKVISNPTSKSNLQPLTEESESLRNLIDTIIKYSQQRTKIIEEYFKKKTKKGKHVFRFPFILKQEHVVSLTNYIQRRLNESYNDNYRFQFYAQAEYTNHDTLSFQSQKDFFEAIHTEKMLRVVMNWEYALDIDIDGLVVSHPFDIIIKYEVEQDSDEKERYKLEEWGIIYVEGLENDWINGTLNELKTIVSSTKMPFWFRWPKLALLYLRDFIGPIVYVTVLVLVFSFLPAIFSLDNRMQVFLEQIRSVTDVAEKLQQYIEYTLTSSDISKTIILYNLFGLIVTVIFSILLWKLSRYLFPPSMILIGSVKEKQKHTLTTYTFVWGVIATIVIGAIVTAVAKFLGI